jgi:transcriptional regulator with XRE-family HTH domain
MTKKELAERINIDPKTLKNWETSKPELIKLIYLGLATEQHIQDVTEYLTVIQKNLIVTREK